MSINNLPNHVLYYICKYLSFIDIINLSKTCKQLYILIENDNYFWMMMIKNRFGLNLYRRYVHEIFHNEKNSNYVLYRTDKDIEKFEKSFQKHAEFQMCNIWLLNMLNAKDNSDGYLAYKSIIKQKLRPRTNELKMSLTMEEFFEYYLKTNENLTKENILQISFYKLIYFYLIEFKHLLAVDLFPISLRCSSGHLYCTQDYPTVENDSNSLTGRCVRLTVNIMM